MWFGVKVNRVVFFELHAFVRPVSELTQTRETDSANAGTEIGEHWHYRREGEGQRRSGGDDEAMRRSRERGRAASRVKT